MAKPYFRSNYHEVNTQFEPPFDNCVCVPLTRGHHALIDAEDFEKVSPILWCAIQNEAGNIYANSSKPIGRMHTFIFGNKDTILVDHINCNGLDNRKLNFRPATKTDNNRNRSPNKNRSQYKGVTWRAKRSNYYTRITINDTGKFLGNFKTAEEGARAYDVAALKYFGEFAYTNFPKEDYLTAARATKHQEG